MAPLYEKGFLMPRRVLLDSKIHPLGSVPPEEAKTLREVDMGTVKPVLVPEIPKPSEKPPAPVEGHEEEYLSSVFGLLKEKLGDIHAFIFGEALLSDECRKTLLARCSRIALAVEDSAEEKDAANAMVSFLKEVVVSSMDTSFEAFLDEYGGEDEPPEDESPGP